MEKKLNNGFCEMTQEEMMNENGGAFPIIILPIIAIAALAKEASDRKKL